MTSHPVFRSFLKWPAACLALLASVAVWGQSAQAQGLRFDLPVPLSAPATVCGTDGDYLQSRGLAVSQQIVDGQGLMFDQTPAILRPDHSGNFSITAQIVGDFPTLQFQRSDLEVTEETWSRSATRTVSGRIVSIFEKVYPDSELARILRVRPWGSATEVCFGDTW